MEQEHTKKARIGGLMIAVLVGFAAIADALTLIPFVGVAVGPLFWIGVSIYLWSKGYGFLRPGRLVAQAISFVAELVPAVQALPTILAGTVVVIALIKFEDKTGVSVIKTMSGKGGRAPLNHGGTRLPQGHSASVPDFPRNPNTRPLNVDGMRQAVNTTKDIKRMNTDNDLPMAA